MLNPANYIQSFVAVAVSFSIAYGLHTCSAQLMEKQHVQAIAAERKACIANEKKNQSITTGASNVFQDGLIQLEHDYADIMQQRSCVSIIDTGSATGRLDAATGKGKPGINHEVHSEQLYKFSKDCEIDRLTVIGLQKFIEDERK